MSLQEQTKKRGLGRGLSSLLGDVQEGTPHKTETILYLQASVIHPSTLQPRKLFNEQDLRYLEQSIREKGILQPLLVRAHPKIYGEYELIAGERRWRASQMAGLINLPALVIEASDQDVLEAALIENIQRADLTPIEEGEGYARLMEEFSYTQERLSGMLGRSRSHVANTLRLLNLPHAIKTFVHEGYLTAGHARCLINIPDAAILAEQIIKRELSVRETERLIRQHNESPSKPLKEEDSNITSIAEHLEQLLGLPVSITLKGMGGKIILQYKSPDDLDQLLSRLHHLAAA